MFFQFARLVPSTVVACFVATSIGGCSTADTRSTESAPNFGGANGEGGSLITSSSSATGGSTATGGATASSTTGGTTASATATGGATASSTTGGTTASATATGGRTATGTGGGSATTTCTADADKKFSFFLLSQAALQLDSGKTDGYGGDLGGITGADAICQRIAEKSSPCQKSRTWHAFLSTSTVNAKDRIGTGPWYDRLGRTLATNLTNLLTERPTGADPTITNDFPNEDGVPNHSPDGTLVDNHEILTGTGPDGNVYTQSATSGGFPGGDTSCGPTGQETWSVEAATCWGWTSKEGKGCPRVGHSWPRVGSGVGWISVWNEGGCAPGGTVAETLGLDGTRRVGSAGGYGGFYCFAVTGN